MRLIKEKVRFKGRDIKLKFSLGNNYNSSGMQQSIDTFVNNTIEDAINPTEDSEKIRFLINVKPNNYIFTFFDSLGNPSFILSDVGFGVNDAANGTSTILNSFYVMQIYDSVSLENQNLLHTSYYGGVNFSANTTTYNISKSDEFHSIYLPKSFLDEQDNTFSVYAKYSFFNGATGEITVFQNENLLSDVDVSRIYYQLNFNKTTRIYGYASTGSSVELIEINSDEYQTLFSNSLGSIERKSVQYPTGNKFNSDGTYSEID